MIVARKRRLFTISPVSGSLWMDMDQSMRPTKAADFTLLILIGTIIVVALGWKLFPMDRYAAMIPNAYTPPTNTAMTISSPAFQAGAAIPVVYTCDGSSRNPPLAFGEVPTAAKSFALIMHDPDAPVGDFTHWTMWNMAPGTREIAEGSVPAGAVLGATDAGSSGYVGPCPPNGSHRYIFELYALDAMMDLPSGVPRIDLEAAMQGHVLDHAELIGTYAR
jgi:hypothetical protein